MCFLDIDYTLRLRLDLPSKEIDVEEDILPVVKVEFVNFNHDISH